MNQQTWTQKLDNLYLYVSVHEDSNGDETEIRFTPLQHADNGSTDLPYAGNARYYEGLVGVAYLYPNQDTPSAVIIPMYPSPTRVDMDRVNLMHKTLTMVRSALERYAAKHGDVVSLGQAALRFARALKVSQVIIAGDEDTIWTGGGIVAAVDRLAYQEHGKLRLLARKYTGKI